MDQPPKSIVYLRPDTIGDLVLFSSALGELRGRWPDARHTIVVRPAYAELRELMPAGLNWITAAINPFQEGPREAAVTLDGLLSQLEHLQPDLIVAATLTRTWLEAAVAAHFPKARRVALGQSEVDPLFATALRLERGVDSKSAFSECVEVDPEKTDWENNHRLVTHLTGRASTNPLPQLRVDAGATEAATRTLADWGAMPGKWIALFPGGLANVPIKAWPTARFAEVAVRLKRQRGLPIVLVGHRTDAPTLDAVSTEMARLGETEIPRWIGEDGQLSRLAALLGQCALYLGNDTGAMHIAAAVGARTLGIFGGGHWPRFRPVGRQVAAAVQPLPCFNCGWDCQFGEALCVKTLGTATVEKAALALLDANDSRVDLVAEAADLSSDVIATIAGVTPRFRALQKDRLARQSRIEELKRETDGKDDEIAALKLSAEERKQEMESIKAELEAECETKDTEIAQLKREADTKDVEIAQLKREADTKDAEIAQLKAVCDEREALIITQDQHIKRFQAAAAEHDKTLAAKDQRIADFERWRAVMPLDVEIWGQAMHDKNVHIRNLEAIIAQHEATIAELRGRVGNFETGLHALESAKYFGRLLAEKETVLQSLHQACVERERIIQQLALSNAGIGRLHKLWISAREHVRLKWWLPLRQWGFRKLVEEYWMQIGVLRHHDPRPIRWDRMPAGRCRDDQLPAIGIVTPSYGQATFIGSTLLSVLNQQYPKLKYVVQDGGSKDDSVSIIASHADRLHHWESVRDNGQADAIRRGFARLEGVLGPDDLMAWLNSDDLVAPRALRYVAEYFARHPEVDAVYGHRIIIDEYDREVGRWIMPPHDPRALEWIDYVPQETLFWRKRIWDRAGGIDPSFQFALDWDLLARFQLAGAKIVRLPYALGCFRVHAEQKTNQHIHTIGNEEMIRVRRRFHGENHSDPDKINHFARKARLAGALTARLAALGIRY